MKKLLILFCLCIAVFSAAAAEGSDDAALLGRIWQTGPEPLAEAALPMPELNDPVSYKSVTVPRGTDAVDMGDTVVSNYPAFTAFLDQLPNLRKVDMYATEIPVRQIEMLSARYPRVEFGWSMFIGTESHHHVIRTDAEVFSTLHSNKSPQHTDSDFAVLRFCKNMKALDIGHNACTDLSFLYHMPGLRVLIIGRNSVADLTPIATLHDLQYLEAFSNVIYDLTPLAALPNLLDLNLCFNKISDYSPLYTVTTLKKLWIYNSNSYDEKYPVDRDKVKALKAALPHCYVDSTSYVTEGDWRKGEHYEIIYRMFRSGVFTPFSEPLIEGD